MHPNLAAFVITTINRVSAEWEKRDQKFNITVMEKFHINSRLRKKISTARK